MAHTLTDVIERTIKATILKCYPVGSYWLTESNDNPATRSAGRGRKLQASACGALTARIRRGLISPPDCRILRGGFKICGGSGGFDSRWGAFNNGKPSTPLNSYTPTSTYENANVADFNAFRSNAIYGNSDTVQPPAHVVNVWKRTA